MRTLLRCVAGLAIVAACSSAPPTAMAFCNELAQVYCNRLYACASGAALDQIEAQYGPTPVACATYFQVQAHCADLLCASYSDTNAQACIDAVNGEACGTLDFASPPAPCNSVCGGPSLDGGPDSAPPCEGQVVNCNGVCVDLETDPANCGGCGISCAPPDVCQGGQCTGDCVADNGACVVDSDCCTDFCASDGLCGCIPTSASGCVIDADCCSASCDVQTGVCN